MIKITVTLLFIASITFAGAVPTLEDIGTLEALGADPYKNMQLCFPYIVFTDWNGDGENDVILSGVTYTNNSGGRQTLGVRYFRAP